MERVIREKSSVVARKWHECECCGVDIGPGRRYKLLVVLDDDDVPVSLHFCFGGCDVDDDDDLYGPNCDAAFEAARERATFGD